VSARSDRSCAFDVHADAADFVWTLLGFLDAHPSLGASPIVIVGESYGGTRAIAMVSLMLQRHPSIAVKHCGADPAAGRGPHADGSPASDDRRGPYVGATLPSGRESSTCGCPTVTTTVWRRAQRKRSRRSSIWRTSRVSAPPIASARFVPANGGDMLKDANAALDRSLGALGKQDAYLGFGPACTDNSFLGDKSANGEGEARELVASLADGRCRFFITHAKWDASIYTPAIPSTLVISAVATSVKVDVVPRAGRRASGLDASGRAERDGGDPLPVVRRIGPRGVRHGGRASPRRRRRVARRVGLLKAGPCKEAGRERERNGLRAVRRSR